jgi:pimeloyl-ACP methyl ester carboxylesterase
LIASVWNGRIVSDSTLDSRINAVRKAVGDSGGQQRLVRTMSRKGFRFVGAVTSKGKTGKHEDSSAAPLQQEVHFCTASDGVRIAYAVAGRGPPLVKAANWLNHLEYDWQSPIWSELLHELAASHWLVRYDERGNGLSDWDVDDISFKAFVRDLESVVDAAGLERFALLGISQGCAVSIVYAIRHPERISHLVLHGGFARGRARRDLEHARTLLSLVKQGWGQENPAFRQFFTSLFLPEGTPEQMQWFNDLQRITTSPENAVRIMEATGELDIPDLLPQVRVPTLVLHCRNDAAVVLDEGRRLAAGIPGAKFVALESRNHLVLESEPAWEKFIGEIKTFLAS